ncbi:ComEA family DNA-binding protein, partial [Corynebacterium falsenii]
GAGGVNINTADARLLESLPGVGPATAQAIVAHRDSHGPFTSVEQLMEVKGIGPAKFEAIKDAITL